MSIQFLIYLGPIIGVVVGSLGTVAVTWITKYYEEQSSYRKLIVETSLEYYREALIAARNSVKGTSRRAVVWPYESFVISISHLVNRVINKKFKIEEIDDIVSENKKLIKALEGLYSEDKHKERNKES